MRSTNPALSEVSDSAVAPVIEVKDMIPDHRIAGTRTSPARIKFTSRRKEKKQTAYHINLRSNPTTKYGTQNLRQFLCTRGMAAGCEKLFAAGGLVARSSILLEETPSSPRP
ncbi:hypothetical protein MRS44_003316 [Fusarium solani]|nr:hypothetical protein MRS44_003316 [Fusarium solani]KAJ4229897.1 hypothetical protein NW759_003262 [Fusarium solani]